MYSMRLMFACGIGLAMLAACTTEASTDGGSPDSAADGATDSGALDSGAGDSATADGGRPDSGTMDSGARDSATADSGPLETDAGLRDAGPACGSGACDAWETCGSCPSDCGTCAPAFADAPAPTEFQVGLTCDYGWALPLDARGQATMAGAGISSVVGLDDRFGGVGAKFALRNNAFPDSWVDILEPRSGAGAGWQTSFLVDDAAGGAGIIVFNQAAGNGVSSQWGYGTTFVEDGQNIHATTWIPLASDHIHTVAGGHSPCLSTGYVFDDGAVDIAGAGVETPHGTALAWRNRYRYRSRTNQSWAGWSAEQAFYLSRSVARAAGLRLYLVRGTTRHGPFAIYDAFTIPEASCTDSFCNTPGYDYAVLVWNIHGLDIGVALPVGGGTSINLEQTTYCTNPADDACGNINFHSWVVRDRPAAYAMGSVREASQVYYVGTLSQLADLGFATW